LTAGPRYHGYPERGFGPVATGTSLDPTLDWREIDRITARAALPVVLKGTLAIAGEEGVRELFLRLGEELRNALTLTGQVDASRVDPSIVVRG
jgi:isopentenyl diphosphate isomerase/L-lactate dehydrogenase-like FMN-dependent dehydrogenase